MHINANFTISAEITITSAEAKILNHLLSYNVAKTFAMEFSKEYTAEQIKTQLEQLRRQVRMVLEAKEAADAAVQEIINPKR